MKKITLLAAFVATSMTVSAQTQDFYLFSQSTGIYADLTNPTSMNNGQVWDFDEFGPVTSPFSLSVFGEIYNDFGFDDDFFYFGQMYPVVDAIILDPLNAYIMDRDFSFQGPSQSPISYQVEGTTGNRILKLEVKNAGLEIEEENSSTSTLYLNYQVWFYEVDNSIEYHYGNHNITNLTMLNDSGVCVVAFGYEDEVNDEILVGYLNDTTTFLSYSETTDNNDIIELNWIPAPNTIYRFEVNPLAVRAQEKVQFSVFPNPTTEVLNVAFEENINKEYTIYDSSGRYVLSGVVDNTNSTQINVSSLQGGTYILKIGATVNKFIKK